MKTKQRGTGYQLAEQRKNIIRKIRRATYELIHWIEQSDERYQAREGGLGRKRK